MAFKIGFTANYPSGASEAVEHPATQSPAPRKSVVQIYFPTRNMTLAYYNDRFDLQRGNLVYVDGKLEGLLGRVTDVNYNFKIRLSDYKRVIAVADTSVKGKFYSAKSHFVTFDADALPYRKVITWFRAPTEGEEEIVSGSDDTGFCLNDPSGMGVSDAVAERGGSYYMDNRVKYIGIDGTHGHAIVEGSEIYEVEFEYRNGEIRGLVCSCYCSYNCKHEYAVMLQLKETLDFIEKHYKDAYECTHCFAAITKTDFFSFVVDGTETGCITL